MDNWDQDWGFDDTTSGTTEQDPEPVEGNGDGSSSNNWLQKCLLSVSPTNDVVAVAHEHKICVLTRMCCKNISFC